MPGPFLTKQMCCFQNCLSCKLSIALKMVSLHSLFKFPPYFKLTSKLSSIQIVIPGPLCYSPLTGLQMFQFQTFGFRTLGFKTFRFQTNGFQMFTVIQSYPFKKAPVTLPVSCLRNFIFFQI